ncbi:MAG TPA: rhodanese-like domain-containing protein [Bacteroidia bacterium]|nr:rhodanese-like domain-containing protein [Bacteroidia bacterium]
MINTLKKIFGLGPKVDLQQWMKEGAVIIDVRTKGEYSGGHVKGSVNIPLDQLSGNLKKLKSKDQAIITCCASGMRSGSAAKSSLKSQVYTKVHNGGSWYNLRKYEK